MPGHGYGYRPRTWDCVHMTSEAILTALIFYLWVIRNREKTDQNRTIKRLLVLRV
jgi:hypothetical protein